MQPDLLHWVTWSLILIFLFTSVGCGATPTTTPSPSEVATMTTDPMVAIQPVSISLSGQWRFSIDKDKVGEQQGWTNPEFDDSSWATIKVPHTWNVMSKHSEYEGFAWY